MKKYTLEDTLFGFFGSFAISFIILISFCYLNKFHFIKSAVDILSLALGTFVILLWLLKFKFSKFTLTFFLYILVLLIATLLGDYSSLLLYFKTFFKIITIVVYFDLGFKKHAKSIIKGFGYAYLILIFINFLTIVAHPQGLYTTDYFTNNWFLGYDNTHIFVYLPAMVIWMILKDLEKTNKNKAIFLLLLAIITYSVYHCFSATSVVGYTMFLIYIIIHKYIDKISFFNSINYYVSSFVIFFLFVVFKIQNLFSWLIVNVLHKNLTFTGRTIIWNTVLMYIKQRPIIGYGLETAEIVGRKFGHPTFSHAHNTFLDVTYKGGIVAILLFCTLMYIAVKKLYEYKDNKIAKIISFSLFCIFIMMNFEARQEKIGFFIILLLAYNVKYIIDLSKHKEEVE